MKVSIQIDGLNIEANTTEAAQHAVQLLANLVMAPVRTVTTVTTTKPVKRRETRRREVALAPEARAPRQDKPKPAERPAKAKLAGRTVSPLHAAVLDERRGKMLELMKRGPVTLSQLARHVGIEANLAFNDVRMLREKGLIERAGQNWILATGSAK